MQSTSRRRRWNNYLILGVVAFMLLLNLPTIIKNYLIDTPVETEHPYLLNPNQQLKALHSNQWSLTYDRQDWTLSIPSSIAPQELALRWDTLVGTEISDQLYQSLKPSLQSPISIEVWYFEQEEPQRVTSYQLPQFWLLKNWQDKWIAVTVEQNYLFPVVNDFSNDQ
ncbi:hypothetical protein L4C38_12610 [Vibrio kasasachensis]|uniref:hypothetical protein n=1 Tax=Vibrio kasasachensis TaxID=2910248 RepID=UPI003D0FF6F1